ncbi:MAG: Lsr2 family protein [Rhodococcus sp. (in: high G+C Gram-positive bacteria)]
MARQVFVELVDDIDGAPIKSGKGETIGFSVDGVEYEIDLGAKNAKEFRKQLDYWTEHATKVAARGKKATAKKSVNGSSPSTPARDPLQTKAIREWANQNGYSVSSRGRIPADVEEAYNSAQ